MLALMTSTPTTAESIANTITDVATSLKNDQHDVITSDVYNG